MMALRKVSAFRGMPFTHRSLTTEPAAPAPKPVANGRAAAPGTITVVPAPSVEPTVMLVRSRTLQLSPSKGFWPFTTNLNVPVTAVFVPAAMAHLPQKAPKRAPLKAVNVIRIPLRKVPRVRTRLAAVAALRTARAAPTAALAPNVMNAAAMLTTAVAAIAR